MTGIVDWAASRARMVLAFIALSLLAGGFAYTSLPKEGEPDIEIPALFVSVPFPGISAEDSESLLVKVMETELSDLDGLKEMTSTAAEGYAGVALEFEFGWDKSRIMADVREAMNTAEGKFPDGFEKYSINEINFSEFPIIIVNLTGDVPERTMTRVAKDLQDRVEALDAVLEAGIAGNRDEMVEVVIDPLRLESYNVTAGELINVVQNNNMLIPAGEVETADGAFSVKIPSSFDEPRDIYSLPVKVNGDRVVTLGDLADIRLTFEDRTGTARFNGDPTVALQVVKRKGFNLIDTADEVQRVVEAAHAEFPEDLRATVNLGTSNDQSRIVASMVAQLEGSVLTAIALVMIVVLASLGSRAALLVGFAIPTSFLLCFVLLAVMGITISNIVMFGLILAVGMLVDGAIVVVEYADKRVSEGVGPMHAYVEAAKRMFWPIISSTATTLCAFLPMLFWPGVPGEFMGMLPVTLIFVLCASLIVVMIYLPVVGGVTGRISRGFSRASDALRARTPWLLRAALVPVPIYAMFVGAMQTINPGYLFAPMGQENLLPGAAAALPGIALFVLAAFGASITLSAAKITWRRRTVRSGRRRTLFGWLITGIAGNPVMPIVMIAAVIGFVGGVFMYFGQNNNGVEFFTDSEPEQAIVYVRARGNLSLAEKDALVAQVEKVVLDHPGILNAFAFAGDGGLNNNTGGAQPPLDTIGQVQLETIPWEDRAAYAAAHPDEVTLERLDGDVIIDELTAKLETIPGIKIEILAQSGGPASAKPVHLRLKGDNWNALIEATELVRARYEGTPGLTLIEDTLPLPGIDWQIDVDVEKAGRYGADVATVGAMVQLVTRGLMLDTMRVDTSDEEIEIRVRLPQDDRVLSTLDTLKVRTQDGLMPLANFISRQPVPKLAEIKRVDGTRYFDVKAGVRDGMMDYKLVPLDANGEPQPENAVSLGFGNEVTPEAVAEGAPYTLALTTARSGAMAWLDGLLGAPAATYYHLPQADAVPLDEIARAVESGEAQITGTPITANERIAVLNEWLESDALPAGVDHEWTGDQEDQAESQQFLQSAFAAALGLMFIILLAQFNSFYNAALVLIAVVLSTTGVLIGMLVMDQPFSIIMTGTGIVALAGIVVNNNIVLIDTYQDYSRYMPRIEAIIRTAEDRLRPVILTTVTTMAGLAPMMLGLSLDFINGGYSLDSPTALWWKQLATAVVFGLGIATLLTLVFTPSLLALRVWASTYVTTVGRVFALLTRGRSSRAAQDWALRRAARRLKAPEIIWEEDAVPTVIHRPVPPLKAAE
ncbi:efflux RND transporter permease subunit [Lutimaribacter sp. EGI FJ00015]|uniref:Efflux RND transporter permease subunit n=1 Tax=Lutimaribacter degradans TaxID=2945989 RepID=A0ACC5ZTX6_9RHOB|nr:efflux RND transporter permease subunit [Lutimaribacter sp. EGI FJ00013]MCM2561231.1 efflux RND transporter permease subunit [Lutimaribacter sp. EGI FJ00013]MCO0611820.1 efflux RND transporter permease subunit [Lutimaribacter sp. EGI FJ00015]MCO0635059.1 efflux RND transporter permease subunit [Lutimaribacter sp. EGI FJ00014]